MNEQMMRERIQQALNAQMSGVRTSPAERSRMLENAIGGTKVKRKLTVGLVFAIILVLMTAACAAPAIVSLAKGRYDTVFYPNFVMAEGSAAGAAGYASFAILAMIPVAADIMENIRWKYLTSRI